MNKWVGLIVSKAAAAPSNAGLAVSSSQV